MERRTSICRNCGALCPIVVTIDAGRVLKVEGDAEAPLYHGFTCPKGRALPQQHHRPNRLLHSLKRLPDGSFVPISSEQLIDEIAEKVGRIIDAHGPQAVGAFLGTAVAEQPAASGMMLSFLRAIGSSMMFSNITIDQPGLVLANALHGQWEGGRIHPRQWDALLVVGANPVVSKQYLSQNPAQQLKDLANGGTKLIVIDPRRTETARRATVHLQTIPGEDPTVLAGLIHLIFAMDGVDRGFAEANVDGLAAIEEAVRDFTPDYVAARSGVDAEALVAAARILVEAKRGDTALGVGPAMATRGTLSSYLALCLQTLRGYWAREGDPVSRPRVLTPAKVSRAQPSAPTPAWGFAPKLARGLQMTVAGMPTAALPDMMLAEGEDRLRAMFLHSGAAYTWPQTGRSREALSALDLLVTHDIELSATSALADYVVATRTQLEVAAFSQAAEVTGAVHPGYDWLEPYGVYQPAVIAPPEGSDTLESWQTYYRVAKKLGLQLQYFDYAGDNAAPPAIDMTAEPTTEDLYALICRNSAVPFEKVKAMPHGGVFEEARTVVAPRDRGCNARLQLGDPAMIEELRAVRSEDILARRRTDDDYPYLLISRRMQNCTNSSPRAEGLIRTAYNPAFLHPDDLEALGLGAGAHVEIRSRHGAITGFVEADPELRRGVVAMTHGFGARHGQAHDPRRDGSNVNELTSWDDDFDPYHGMPRMSALPVSVRAVAETAILSTDVVPAEAGIS